MADTVNLRVYKGQKLNVTLKRSQGTKSATGINMLASVRAAQNDPNSSTLFTAIPVGAGDTITFTFTAANNTIGPGTFYWDLWQTDAGSEDLFAIGTYEVLPEVRVT